MHFLQDGQLFQGTKEYVHRYLITILHKFAPSNTYTYWFALVQYGNVLLSYVQEYVLQFYQLSIIYHPSETLLGYDWLVTKNTIRKHNCTYLPLFNSFGFLTKQPMFTMFFTSIIFSSCSIEFLPDGVLGQEKSLKKGQIGQEQVTRVVLTYLKFNSST